MTDHPTALQGELARLFTPDELQRGFSIVVALDRTDPACPRLQKLGSWESITFAIQRAGELSEHEQSLVVATVSAGSPLIVARYGDAWGMI